MSFQEPEASMYALADMGLCLIAVSGEQSWWLGVLCFAVSSSGGIASFVSCGAKCWAVAFGVCFNHPLDTFVTLPLIEGRMLCKPERVALFRAYQQRTSLLVPWWPAVVDAKAVKAA